MVAISRLLLPFQNSCARRASQRDRIGWGIPAYFWRNATLARLVKYLRKIMTSQELLLALADGETLELARKMIGKPRLAFLLAKQAIGPEGETSLDAEAVAQVLGVHKRHAYRLIKSASCQKKKQSQTVPRRVTIRHNRKSPKKTCVIGAVANEDYLRSRQTNREICTSKSDARVFFENLTRAVALAGTSLPGSVTIKSVCSCFPMFVIFRPKIQRLGDRFGCTKVREWFSESTKLQGSVRVFLPQQPFIHGNC